MLLHLGGDWAANSRRIIAILDYSSVSGSRATKKLVSLAEGRGMLEHIDGEADTRSVILLDTNRGMRLILSPISASALKGRLTSNAIYLEYANGAASGKAGRKGRS